MAVYGYARVSTTDQDLTIQIEDLKSHGAEIVRSEKVSGTSRTGRTELANLMEFMRAGDTLMITRLDRLCRSVKDLQDIVLELKDKGVELKATQQPISTHDAASKAFLDMLGVFSELETNLRRERQMEGIRKRQAAGGYKGRKASIDAERIKELKASGMKPAHIARELGISRTSVYRLMSGSAG